jgi:hypothetical protein
MFYNLGHFDFGDLIAATLTVVTALLTGFYFIFTSRLLRKYKDVGQKIDVMNLRPQSVNFTETELVVVFADGSKIVTPLEWYPKLEKANVVERSDYEVLRTAIRWPRLNEDVSVARMLRGRRIRRSDQAATQTLS